MEPIELTHTDLATAESQVRGTAHRLESLKQDLTREVRRFVGSGWSGAAASSYTESFERWCTGAVDVLEGLVAMADLIGVTSNDFRQTDEEARLELAALADKIVARLG